MNEAILTLDKSLAHNQNNTTTQPPNNSSDCKTLVYQRLHGGRTTMTIRVLPVLKNDFRRTREFGLKTCHVAEGLIKGWLYGLERKTELVHQSPTINLTLLTARRAQIKRESPFLSINEEIGFVRGKLGFSPLRVLSLKPHSRIGRGRDRWAK